MTDENKTENFIFYRSFFECISEFSDADRLQLYDALVNYAFSDTITEFEGMKKGVFSMMMPLISASIKNYKNGSKGGRPPREVRGLGTKEQREVSSDEIEEFITDYKEYKCADFEPTELDKTQIKTLLSYMEKYKPSYWQKVFKIAAGGFEINGEITPCSFKKILLDHNKIYSGELKFAPNKKEKAKKQQEQQKEKEDKQLQEKMQVDLELEQRNAARQKVTDAVSAVEFLNEFVPVGEMTRKISHDYKEFKQIYPIDIKDGVYVLCQN